MFLLPLLCFTSFLGCCVCPSRDQVDKIKTIAGTWEAGSGGSVPGGSLAVVGAIDPIDKERQYVCRAHGSGGAVIPGKLVTVQENCYYPRSGYEWHSYTYEVLVNREGYNYVWGANRDGWFQENAVVAGIASTWPMAVCRAWHKGRQDVMRQVPGKVDPQPGYECCYISYAGYEYCYKEYEVLYHRD